jgi:hypothetical protein
MLRRAVAFIDEQAHTDITVADVAAAARVTRQAYGAHPSQALRPGA